MSQLTIVSVPACAVLLVLASNTPSAAQTAPPVVETPAAAPISPAATPETPIAKEAPVNAAGELPTVEVTAPKAKSARQKVKAKAPPVKQTQTASQKQPKALTPPPGTTIDSDVALNTSADTATGTTTDTTKAIGNPPAAYAGGQVATGTRVGFFGNQSSANVPISATGYTNKLIADQQAKSLSELVANEPSIRPAFNSAASSENFVFRGFYYAPTDVMVDGIAGILDGNRLPIELYDRIEILKGPAAFLNGASPTGSIVGSINAVPKFATDAPINAVSANYWSDQNFGLTADVGRRFGDSKEWGFRAAGVVRDGDTDITNYSEQLGAFEATLDYRGDRLRAYADFGYKKIDVTGYSIIYFPSAALSHIPDAPDLNSNVANRWQTGETEHEHGIAKFEYDVLKNTTVFASYSKAHSDSVYNAPTASFLANVAGDTFSSVFRNRTTQDTEYVDAGVRSRFETGPLQHNVNISASSTWLDTFYRNVYPGISLPSNIYDPVYVPKPIYASNHEGPPQSRSLLQGISFADTVSWNDRILLTVGGRQQRIKNNTYTDVVSGPQALVSIDDTDRYSPFYGVVVKPLSGLSVYASYMEGLQAGGLATIGSNAGQQIGPYVTKQKEAGIKYDFGKLAVNLALFEIEQPSAFLNSATNIYGLEGLQRNRGIELSTYGQLTHSVRVLGGISITDGKLVETENGTYDGNTAIGVPDVQLNIGGEWDVPFFDGLTLTGRYIYTSSQMVNQSNTLSIPSWDRFDVGARYVVNPYDAYPVTMRFNVENVTDNDYWQSSGRGFLSLGAPRTFRLSVGTEF